MLQREQVFWMTQVAHARANFCDHVFIEVGIPKELLADVAVFQLSLSIALFHTNSLMGSSTDGGKHHTHRLAELTLKNWSMLIGSESI
jgi:hypothetical protein